MKADQHDYKFTELSHILITKSQLAFVGCYACHLFAVGSIATHVKNKDGCTQHLRHTWYFPTTNTHECCEQRQQHYDNNQQ